VAKRGRLVLSRRGEGPGFHRAFGWPLQEASQLLLLPQQLFDTLALGFVFAAGPVKESCTSNRVALMESGNKNLALGHGISAWLRGSPATFLLFPGLG
jgi:hypothetical protein